jgi:hypothetical protein
VAIDWVEIRSPSGFTASSSTVLRGAGILVLLTLAVFGLGGGMRAALTMILLLVAFIASAFASDPVAGERILRGGLVSVVLTLAIGYPICRFSGILAGGQAARLALLTATLLTLASRLAFLHPQAFYPDYRVHALVQQTIHSQGLSLFSDKLLETQYARSLGLQQVHGNWYPFPYPPGFYVATEGVLRLFGLDPLDASTVTAIAAASLIPPLTMAVGLSLGLGEGISLSSAFFVALHPLLVRRMALGYFPGLAGQFVDAMVLLLIARFVRTPPPSLSQAGLVTVALAIAFLTYTQSIANFGLMIGALVFVEFVRRRPSGAKTALSLALAGTIALSASVALFYSRYAPVLENVLNQKPQPESTVLDRLDQLRRNPATTADTTSEAEDVEDQYRGRTVNPIRALARLLTRVWRFNGPFLVAVAMGLVLLWRQSDLKTQNTLFAWFSVCVWISLLAAGLPSPNPFQHLKDLEFVTPLLSLALGLLCKRLWDRRPLFGAAFAGAWFVFAIGWYWVELADRMVVRADF